MNPTAPATRRLPIAALAPWFAVAALAWLGVIAVARGMGAMTGTMGLGLGAFVAVWTLMMSAMMLPAVAPFAAFYARTFTERRATRRSLFVAGYLTAWAAVAVPAFGLAWVADRLVAGHPNGATALAVVIFAACGIYQLTPLKDRCLALCRSPLGFAMRYRHVRGRTRDFRVGLRHGLFCLGCCWALMGLLLAFGLMNVTAMAVLAIIVVAEREWRHGPALARVVGILVLGLAVVVIFRPSLAPGLHHGTTMTTSKMGGM